MTPLEVTRLFVILGVPILIARITVVLTRPRRTSKLWTFAIPTTALLFLFVRISITQNLDGVIPSDDWIATASWAIVVASQALATLWQWFPASLFRTRSQRP